MGYTHFQGPIGGGPAIDPKFPPTEDYLSPYHHHHHHMHLNHHHHSSISPLHNGYAGPGGNGGSANVMLPGGGVGSNLQPVDYYGNSNNIANSNYSYAAQSNNNYYNQQQQQHQSQHHSHHHHHLPPPPPPTVASPANGSPSVFNLNSATNGSSVPGSNNNTVGQPSNLDAYNNGNLTEMASAPSTTSTVSAAAAAALNHSAIHPYSAATAAVTSSPGLGLSTGGSAAGGLVNSYYGGYYGAAAAQVEPTNTALELQELGNF